MPNFRQRKWLFMGIAIAIIILITLVAAPSSGGSKNNNGSTYARIPEGYGAWYAYMSRKEIPIERWRKPFEQFIEDEIQDVTYLKILSNDSALLDSGAISDLESTWVSQGNTLVILGKYEPATSAPFKSLIPYHQETLANHHIAIATTRRFSPAEKVQSMLEDRYGAVVWQEKMGKGRVFYCSTPYLAANAYQDNLDNYQFLAELVSDHQAIWVDEYIHGYKDKETIAEAQQADILSYLAQTPWFFLLVQSVLIAIVAAVTSFRPFGLPVKPKTQIADNSVAYIAALGGVLEKAKSTDFVVQAIAKDEQRKLQESLGLGKLLVEEQVLVTAYKQQRGDKAAGLKDLSHLLKVSQGRKKISEAQLISWIQQWQKFN